MAIPYNTRDTLRAMSSICDGVFCKKNQFIIDIWQGANVFELVDVSYDKEA